MHLPKGDVEASTYGRSRGVYLCGTSRTPSPTLKWQSTSILQGGFTAVFLNSLAINFVSNDVVVERIQPHVETIIFVRNAFRCRHKRRISASVGGGVHDVPRQLSFFLNVPCKSWVPMEELPHTVVFRRAAGRHPRGFPGRTFPPTVSPLALTSMSFESNEISFWVLQLALS